MKETKVYVDELPKSCWECPCFKNDLEFPCGLSDGTQDYFKDEIDGENCPLKSIKTHDGELVKEVCEKISIELENEIETYCEIRQCNSPHYQGDYVWFNYVKFRKFAEKLKKEFEDE